jgi:hypothetical protein
MAALDDLEVKPANIQNAHLTTSVSKKSWTRLGPEFESNSGKVAIIAHALCGLKSASGSFRNHLSDCLRKMGCASSCKANADLWLKPKTRPDGFQHHLCVLCHVNDVLEIHHNAMTQTQQISKQSPLKAGSLGDPNICLGAKLRKATLENGFEAWTMSPSKHVQEAVKIVKNCLQEKEPGGPWLKKVPTLFVKD